MIVCFLSLIVKFSARDAKLDSRSPVSKLPLFGWLPFTGLLLVVVFDDVRPPLLFIGCSTPPNESNGPDDALYRGKKISLATQ